MDFKFYGLNPKVQRWNRQLFLFLKIKNQNKAKEAEQYIIQDLDFLVAIEKARHDLGFGDNHIYTGSTDSGINDIYIWFDAYMRKLKSEKDFGSLAQVASDICATLNLPYGWTDYVSAYICMNKRPSNIDIEPDLKIDIIGIEHDESLIVRLENGLTREDYKAAWKTFNNYFKELPPAEPTHESLKYRILLDNLRNGMSAGKLAKKYFPIDTKGLTKYQVISQSQLNRDRVKKIIKRLKNGDKKVS